MKSRLFFPGSKILTFDWTGLEPGLDAKTGSFQDLDWTDSQHYKKGMENSSPFPSQDYKQCYIYLFSDIILLLESGSN